MFKQNFVKICTGKGLSPTAVCTAIGLSNSTYSQWTEDSIPRKTTLLKLAEYLEVSVDELKNYDSMFSTQAYHLLYAQNDMWLSLHKSNRYTT